MSEIKSNTPAKNVLTQPISFSKKVNYPTKTKMNLYVDTSAGETLTRTILVGILLAALIVCFTKFGVIDRLSGLNELRGKASQLEATQQQEAATLENFKQVKEDYYRKSGKHLADDEKNLQDRMNMLSVLEYAVSTEGAIDSYQITGNTAQVSLIAADLDKVAQITQTLRENELVNSVNMTRADMTEGQDGAESYVTAAVTVKFNGVE